MGTGEGSRSERTVVGELVTSTACTRYAFLRPTAPISMTGDICSHGHARSHPCSHMFLPAKHGETK